MRGEWLGNQKSPWLVTLYRCTGTISIKSPRIQYVSFKVLDQSGEISLWCHSPAAGRDSIMNSLSSYPLRIQTLDNLNTIILFLVTWNIRPKFNFIVMLRYAKASDHRNFILDWWRSSWDLINEVEEPLD